MSHASSNMNLYEFRLPKGANRPTKRRGRGVGSGHGKTSCRGHKGAGQRSGTAIFPGFEGGQMSLIRRLPKRGFTSRFKKEYRIVNIGDLKKDFSAETGTLTKVLGGGELKKALTVRAHAFSKSALAAIEKAGGKAEVIEIASKLS